VQVVIFVVIGFVDVTSDGSFRFSELAEIQLELEIASF
jgi:hypothetical protein